MTGLFGLDTLVVQRDLASAGQRRDACIWAKKRPRMALVVNAPWGKVFECHGEGAWPIISIEDQKGAIQYPVIDQLNSRDPYSTCRRHDPIGTLKILRKMDLKFEYRDSDSCLLHWQRLPCNCLLESALRWAEAGYLKDPEMGENCSLEYQSVDSTFRGIP
jgi:hypothetical protein